MQKLIYIYTKKIVFRVHVGNYVFVIASAHIIADYHALVGVELTFIVSGIVACVLFSGDIHNFI